MRRKTLNTRENVHAAMRRKAASEKVPLEEAVRRAAERYTGESIKKPHEDGHRRKSRQGG